MAAESQWWKNLTFFVRNTKKITFFWLVRGVTIFSGPSAAPQLSSALDETLASEWNLDGLVVRFCSLAIF